MWAWAMPMLCTISPLRYLYSANKCSAAKRRLGASHWLLRMLPQRMTGHAAQMNVALKRFAREERLVLV